MTIPLNVFKETSHKVMYLSRLYAVGRAQLLNIAQRPPILEVLRGYFSADGDIYSPSTGTINNE
jgi:hypothetical protein